MTSEPLLSICIHTYNRVTYLKKCIDSIIQQDGFHEIEIVVSDNNSSDETQKICLSYQEQYSNIKYFRNEKNLIDQNFNLVLRRATGKLRKLTNDTVIYRPSAIRYMLNVVKSNLVEKPQIYFWSKGLKKNSEDQIIIDNIDDYIDTIGVDLTWIGSVAIWLDDCDDLELLVLHSNSRLGQVPFLIENFRKRKKAIVYNKIIMDSMDVNKKDISYGLHKVFYDNFTGFVKTYVELGVVSNATYENLRKKLLLDFFCYWVANYKVENDKYIFSDEDLEKLVENSYCNERYFNSYKVKLILISFKLLIKKLIKKMVNLISYDKK